LGEEATILAPSADVALNAGSWLAASATNFTFANSTGQIYLEGRRDDQCCRHN
jgi:hypothetical protein